LPERVTDPSVMRRSRDTWPGNYKVGMWAWVLHRITGLGLVLYIFLHILVISTGLAGPASFDEMLHRLHSPVFLVMDSVVLAGALYHSLNGIRLILFDLGIGVRRQREMFWAVMAVAVALFVAAVVKVAPLL